MTTPQRFHERHFPSFLRFRHFFSRTLHWSEHVGIIVTVALLAAFGIWQTRQLVALRHAVADREASLWLTAPFGTVAEPSLLGESVICEPEIARWYYGTGPLCDAGLGADRQDAE
jgi:hypothetical protein